ncbi:hypothetical protein IFR04_002218 [Cadophora malorum]|uniref:Zn(2)-C6 fungal-type domain-containing protein n=1 Tax=Cadophora malorum TaxID=108018 RepID=A0A8H8BUL5_9HELO|nr:hypothetical protein IFR04_002218 [Cadophora malorum]
MHGYQPHPQQMPQPFSAPERAPIREPADFQSPKQQRKTKGHVASACVPCKRAHLRCDEDFRISLRSRACINTFFSLAVAQARLG